jgi:photosystem II stability/assembly factor-like uncharacterized protein/predicted acyltransferase (DUF342 family)
MSTWKKYGGTNKLEKFNNLSVSTIVTDQFTLKNIYVGDWDVCGGMRARDDVNFNRDLNVVGTITCGNINILGSLGVLDTRIVGNLTVDNSLYVGDDIYLDPNGNTLLHGEDGRFGFNTYTPDATVDISSDLIQSLYIQSSASTNKNVIAQNATHDAIVVNVEPSRANIDFYVDGSLNSGNEPDAQLLYEAGGNFTIDVSNSLKIRPRTIFSQDLNKTFQGDERMTVYADAATKPYFPEIYNNEPNFKTGTAAYFVAGDNSSNVFLRMATDSGTGLAIGGGYFANNRIMGTIALTDASDTQYQAINLISGNLTTNLKTSIAINKYTVSTTPEGTNRYAMDINGPIKVTHEELLKTLDASFEIIKTEFYGNTVGFAFGGTSSATSLYTQYFATTTDGGYTWSKYQLVDLAGNPNPNSLENTPHYFNAIFMQSATNIYIAGDSGYFFNSTNGGQTWATITYNNPNNYNIEATALYITTPSNRLIIGVNNATGIGNGRILNSTTFNNISTASFISTGLQRVKAIHGTGDDVVIVGSGGIVPYRTTTNTFGSTIVGTDASFNAVKVYNTSHVVAVGTNVIYYTHNLVFTGSPTWSTVSFAGNLQSVQILDELRAIAVGDAGLIMFSTDGYATWTTVTNSMLDAMGNAILVSGLSYTNVNILTPNDFVLVGKTGDPRQSTVFNVYAPDWLNRPNNNVIEASGNIVVSGDLQINDAGQILTKTNEIFNILPTVAKEINLGNTAVGGNTNVKANLDVTLDITGHQRLFIIGDSSLNGNLMVLKDTSLNQRLFVQQDTSLNANLTVMKDTSLNQRLFVQGDASLNSNLTVMKDTSLNQRLFVRGDASLNSNLTVMLDTSLNKRLFVRGDASLNSNLTVMLDTSLNQRLFVQGDASLNSNLTVMKDTSLNQRLFVQGDASFNSNITVMKDTSLNQRLFVQGDASFNSNITVMKDTSLNQRLFVQGDASFNSNITVMKDTSLNQRLFVQGDASLNSNLTVIKDTSLNQRLFVNGDASFNANVSANQKLFVQGDASFNSNITVIKDTSLNQRLFVGGDASFNSNLTVMKDTSLNMRLFVQGDASLNSNLTVIKDTSLNQRLFVNGDASFNANVSANQKLFVQGDASFNSNITVMKDTSLNQRLFVQGDASFNSNLTVMKDTSLNMRLFVQGDASFNTNIAVLKDTSLNQRLFVNGDASFNSNVSANQKLFVQGDASFNANIAVINDSSLNKRLFVGGDASFNSNIAVLKDTSLNQRLFVNGDASFNSNISANKKLFVLGDASFNSNLTVINDTSLNKRLFVGGDASFNSNVTVINDTSLNKRLFVGGDASFNSNISANQKLFVLGDASFNSNIAVINDSSLNKRLFVGGDASFNSNITVLNDTSLNKRLFVGGDASFNSNISANQKLFVLGDASFNSNLTVINDTSLNKRLFVGGDASFNSNITVLKDTSLNQRLFVQLDASFNGNVTVIKDTSLNQRLFVNGDASFNSNISANRKLFVLQDASFNSNIAVLNDTSLNKRLFVGGDVSLNSKLAVLSDTSLNQKLSVAGQSRLTDLSAQTVDISTILRTNTIDSIPGGTLTIGGTNAGNVTIKTASGATNYLTLGDANSNVQINGNLFLPGSITTINTSINNLEIKNKTILLNDEAVGAGVSALSGLMFRDYNTNNKGHFLMNGTTDGFVFKSSYSPNRVNLDVSGLTLTNGLTQGFVLLKPNVVVGVSADYTMTTGTVEITDIQQLDASLNRRVERNPSTTTATTQVVDTKILATGLYVNKAVDNYTANAQMDIAGNAFITKLGLGTSSVNTNYTLDVAGNTKVSNNVDVSNSLSVQANIYSYGTIIQW